MCGCGVCWRGSEGQERHQRMDIHVKCCKHGVGWCLHACTSRTGCAWVQEIISAASFHGNIGQGKRTLDKMAASEQVRADIYRLLHTHAYIHALRVWRTGTGPTCIPCLYDMRAPPLVCVYGSHAYGLISSPRAMQPSALGDHTTSRMCFAPCTSVQY